MLKTTGLSNLPWRDNDNEVVWDRNLSKSKKSKNAKSGIQTRIRAMGESTFLTPGTRETFNQLKQAFTKVLIFRHFDPECRIWIETDTSGYAIEWVLSRLISDQVTLDSKSILTKSDFGQWHLLAYFSRKMISAETCYKTYDSKLLAIIEVFKI